MWPDVAISSPVCASSLQEIATPACGLVRNDTVLGTRLRRFQQLAKLQFPHHKEVFPCYIHP